MALAGGRDDRRQRDQLLVLAGAGGGQNRRRMRRRPMAMAGGAGGDWQQRRGRQLLADARGDGNWWKQRGLRVLVAVVLQSGRPHSGGLPDRAPGSLVKDPGSKRQDAQTQLVWAAKTDRKHDTAL